MSSDRLAPNTTENPVHILCLEDEKPMQGLILNALTRGQIANVVVTVVGRVKEAIDILRTETIDIFISDRNLKEEDLAPGVPGPTGVHAIAIANQYGVPHIGAFTSDPERLRAELKHSCPEIDIPLLNKVDGPLKLRNWTLDRISEVESSRKGALPPLEVSSPEIEDAPSLQSSEKRYFYSRVGESTIRVVEYDRAPTVDAIDIEPEFETVLISTEETSTGYVRVWEIRPSVEGLPR